MLQGVNTRLVDVQAKLLDLLPVDAVLVGHSLDNDLRALNVRTRQCLVPQHELYKISSD